MSIETWKEEFYNVEARNLIGTSDRECVEHSLVKWRGLIRENLQKHGLIAEASVLRERGGDAEDFRNSFGINSLSCALCQNYSSRYATCIDCPLYKQLGVICNKPYNTFVNLHDPLPMIESLEQTLINLTQE